MGGAPRALKAVTQLSGSHQDAGLLIQSWAAVPGNVEPKQGVTSPLHGVVSDAETSSSECACRLAVV